MTSIAIDWLNQNRHRSFPLERDEWRMKASPESGLDCVLLDALLFDSDADMSMNREMVLERISVDSESAIVSFRYSGKAFSVALSGGDKSGPGSYESVRGVFTVGHWPVTYSLSFSSHAYILDAIGEGTWDIGCKVLPSRVISISDGHGVESVSVNGSAGIDGHEAPAVVKGDVVLEDGYRTSPIIHRGRVLVRVGRRYGLNPCMYDYGEESARDCREPMFFFCGQNAVNSGNIILDGGVGVTVTQGRSYAVRSGTCAGKTIPCIEIVAGAQLMDMYKPEKNTEAGQDEVLDA